MWAYLHSNTCLTLRRALHINRCFVSFAFEKFALELHVKKLRLSTALALNRDARLIHGLCSFRFVLNRCQMRLGDWIRVVSLFWITSKSGLEKKQQRNVTWRILDACSFKFTRWIHSQEASSNPIRWEDDWKRIEVCKRNSIFLSLKKIIDLGRLKANKLRPVGHSTNDRNSLHNERIRRKEFQVVWCSWLVESQSLPLRAV